MKISKLFHTLYGCLMALPVFIIPIFALNILHKETEPISIEVQEKVSVDFNQYVKNYTFVDNTDWNNQVNVNSWEYDNGLKVNFDRGSTSSFYRNYQLIDLPINHKYVLKANAYVSSTDNLVFASVFADRNLPNYPSNRVEFTNTSAETKSVLFTSPTNLIYVGISAQSYSTVEYFFVNTINLFDLTQMYGEGKEPSLEEFNAQFELYYDYTTSQKMLVNKPTPTTYDSTDIGSQFVYALYKPVHDYFNFKDFMGLGSLYDWIQLNIFSGSNSIVFFTLFNFFTYWIFVSFFWLIFDVLMYVPSLVHKMLDKARME